MAKEKSDSVEVFTALIRSIERSQAELLEVMEEKQKAAEKQAKVLIKELEQEIKDLKRRDTELEQFSHTEDHLHFLKIYPSLCIAPHTKNWSEISINTDLSVDVLRTALSRLQETLNEKLRETDSTELKRIQQYAVDVTLDPDTASPYLVLNDEGKHVMCGDTKQKLPDTPKRFTYYIMVVGKQGFSSGRFYYEVQVRGKTEWDLGVVRESVNRKGKIDSCQPQTGFWAVVLRNRNEYKAWDDPWVSLCLREKSQKIGVFVDYEEGLVSFYDVEARSHIYSFTGQTFTEKLYPLFSPCVNDRASRQDTPWTECQPIAGHTHTLIHSHNHTLRTIFQRCQSTYHACLWTGGGNRSTRRKPPRHGENMQTPHTQGGGGNQTPNPGGVRQTC
ncbi:hypothetical protein Q7C36_011416 [Tachysurus vachellii]|uniref:B30.2/SPRY domain-containing protein n=1 Tax=Tachysurus vachellii TaxID=175792 RepID=A0AA88MR63_TACVA|nr:hypothetical protein Q7C36_011416 [Tachysurus vachellii]